MAFTESEKGEIFELYKIHKAMKLTYSEVKNLKYEEISDDNAKRLYQELINYSRNYLELLNKYRNVDTKYSIEKNVPEEMFYLNIIKTVVQENSYVQDAFSYCIEQIGLAINLN